MLYRMLGNYLPNSTRHILELSRVCPERPEYIQDGFRAFCANLGKRLEYLKFLNLEIEVPTRITPQKCHNKEAVNCQGECDRACIIIKSTGRSERPRQFARADSNRSLSKVDRFFFERNTVCDYEVVPHSDIGRGSLMATCTQLQMRFCSVKVDLREPFFVSHRYPSSSSSFSSLRQQIFFILRANSSICHIRIVLDH